MGPIITLLIGIISVILLLLLPRLAGKHGTFFRKSQRDPFSGLDLVYAQVFQSYKLRNHNAHLQNLFRGYGHTFQSKPFGNQEIFTISPRNIQAVYATDFESFGVGPFRNFVLKPLLCDWVITTDGSIWKHIRAIIAPIFSRAFRKFVHELLLYNGVITTDSSIWKHLYTIIAPTFIRAFRKFVLKPLLDDWVMTTDGSIWKHSRAMIAPTFFRAQVEDLTAFDVHVQRLLDLIPKDSSMIDLEPLFQRLALDSTTEFLFGESVKSLAPETPADAQAFLDAYNYAQRGVGKRMMLPSWNIFTRDKKFWKSWESCRVAQAFVDSVVNRSMQQCASSQLPDSQNYVLAFELAKNNIDRVTMREQLLNVFLPTHDAIAIPLTTIFFVLARHPSVWAKLHHEVVDSGLSDPAPAQLKSLKYLQYVISETLRLYPDVSTDERVALKDTVLPAGDGPQGVAPISVKKGTKVTISFYALQRRKDLWKDLWGEDAEDFRPERWENREYGFWTNLPFGGGPMDCPGQERGWIEVAYTIVKMVRVFKEIQNQDAVEAYKDSHRVVRVSKNGAKVALVPL